jgi:hypothetical protein
MQSDRPSSEDEPSGVPLPDPIIPVEEPPEKPKPRSLAEGIAKLWESPVVTSATKAADAYVAKSLAKLNEFLARLNAKK